MRDIAADLIARLTRFGLNGSSLTRKASAFVLGAIDDRCTITTRYGNLTFHVANPIERWRVETLLDKEPDTIAWLDSTIRPDSIFFDIGANIGLYTMYAAHIHRGQTHVVSFEPEALNFARLYRNIFDNDLDRVVGALPLALGDTKGVARLTLSSIEAGRARHVLEQSTNDAVRSEWAASATLDQLAATLGPQWQPTHLKIDVDGVELEILAGGHATLRQPALCHVLVELARESAQQGVAMLADAGLRLVSVGEAFDGWANHIFVRDGDS